MARNTITLKSALYLPLLSVALSSCVDFEEEVLGNVPDNKVATRATGKDKTPYYYYYRGERQYFELDTERVFISMSDERKIKEFTSIATKTLSMRMDTPKRSNDKNFWTTMNFDSKLSDEAYLSKLAEIKASKPDIIVAPYFKNKYQDNIGLSNFFYVKLKQESDVALLEREAAKVNAVIDHQNEFMPLWYVLSVTEKSEFNAMELSNRFYESGLFQCAEPDMLVKAELAAINDPHYNKQWGLNNTGQNGGMAGMDVHAEQAWQISTGMNVVVAVFDSGILLTHPDLAANIHPQSFDSERGTLANPVPQTLESDHGTVVAGVIGALRNNLNDSGSYEGVSGIAPDCKIMSVSHWDVPKPLVPERWANGINWAWQNGADVINNSWRLNPSPLFEPFDDAINNAVTKGRDRKGCVIVAITGNEASSTDYYPSSLPNVIGVGSVDRTGIRAYSSNYGTGLDVVAPGVDIWTTSWTGGYTSTSGTSLAAPLVAGIAALILSVNPDLTQKQVADIIESTAQKVSDGLPDPSPISHTYNYQTTPGRPNGTWDSRMGYGLVDAYAAVANASLTTLLPRSIDGGMNQLVVNIEDTYTFYPAVLPAGVTFDGWTVAPNSYTTSDMTDPALDIIFTGMGKYTLTANFTLPDSTPYRLQRTVEVVSLESITTSWPDEAMLYSNVSYIAADPPEGVTFEGWTVTPGYSGIVSNGPDLDLCGFVYEPGEYTVTANYTLPSGAPYAVSKEVSVVPFVPQLSAELWVGNEPRPMSASTVSALMSTSASTFAIGPPDIPPFPDFPSLITPPDFSNMSIRFFVTNNPEHPDFSQYEWQINDRTEPWYETEMFVDFIPFLTTLVTEGEFRVSCSAPNPPEGNSEPGTFVFDASNIDLDALAGLFQ